MMLEELISKFDEVIVPHLVRAELDNLKDRDRHNKAWLAMMHLDDEITAGRVSFIASPKKDGKPDERILAVAAERAKKASSDNVYMFSNDINFPLLVKETQLPNLDSLSFSSYGEKFPTLTQFDSLKSQRFSSLVKKKNLTAAKQFDLGGVDINLIYGETGFTPLIQAIRNRHYEMVEFLSDLPGIDLDSLDESKYRLTPSAHAVQMKTLDILKLLVKKGADCEMGGGGKNPGNTPLMVSAWDGWKLGIDYLLQLGVCVNQQDNNGFTALIKACRQGNYAIALLLVPLTDVGIRSCDNKKAGAFITRHDDPLAKELIDAIQARERAAT